MPDDGTVPQTNPFDEHTRMWSDEILNPTDCGRHPDCLFQGGCTCRMFGYQSPKQQGETVRTHITLVVDRSGSMAAIQSDAEGAINAFLTEQRKNPEGCTITLVDFDAPGYDRRFPPPKDKNGLWIKTVYQGPIAGCPGYDLVPRGNTALYDAVGMSITDTGEYLAAMAEAERPDKVIFIVQTDGEENSSKDWHLEQIQNIINHQTEKYSWEFIYLGMGTDAWGAGQRMNFRHSTQSASSAQSYVGTYAMATDHVSSLRAGGRGLNLNVDVDEEGKVTERTEK